MKIVVSKAYLKWNDANKTNRASDAIEKFLLRVFKAADSTQVAPLPKAVGGNLRKQTGTVNEFTLNKKYRVYSKYVELTQGEPSFCLATVGVKGVSNQHEDILKALSLFDDITAIEWVEWTPCAEQMEQMEQMEDTAAAAEIAVENDDEPIREPIKQPTAKKKGKPLDENGLTVAERKALRKKQQQEEQKKRQEERKQKEQAKRMEKQMQEEQENKHTAQENTQPPATPDTVAEQTTIPTPKPTVVEVAETTPAATDNTSVKDDTPAKDDMSDNEIRIIQPAEETRTEPTGADIPQPDKPGTDIEFKDFADVQYKLEIIEHQMTIEKLKIQITQSKIALEELAIKKLQLLQIQKMKNLQK